MDTGTIPDLQACNNLGTVQLHYFCHFEKWHQKQTPKPLFDTTNPKKLGTNYIVTVLHQNEGGIGKMDFPIPPEFWWSTDNLSASIFLQGVDQKILPCGQGRIDSVKINPSLLMMREWGFTQVEIQQNKTGPCPWMVQ